MIDMMTVEEDNMGTMTAKEVNDKLCEAYGIPKQLNGGQSVLSNVDIQLRPDSFPTIIAEYYIVKDDIMQEKRIPDGDEAE